MAKRREAEEPKNLTAAQEQAILLLASGETVTATADAVGVSRQTVSEWVNRDPDFIDDPDVFDIRRGAIGHLGFGHGVHHCLGAPLARMEMRIAFPALLRRFPTLELAEDFDEVQFRSFHFIYGLQSLKVRW